MALAFPDLKSLKVPDSQDIIVNGKPTEALIHFLNDLAKLVELLRAYEPPP